ncbi:MAG: ATP-binding cassette domain-containing protein [Firmicutes bacterium]|nr:ATP-binding cassette domain-containing protein [Bacillota bacterium]
MADIVVKNLSFAYAGAAQNALHNISFTAAEGTLTLLCGATGSGKSTLLRHFVKELTPHGKRTGTLRYGDTEIVQLEPLKAAQKFGLVMQNPDNQIVTDNVFSELFFGLENLGFSAAEAHRRVAETVGFFGMESYLHKAIDSLSGGQKQLVNLAAALALRPEVLILDEPTAQLDPVASADFIAALLRINRELGVTVILCEHRLEQIFAHADQVVLLDKGQIAALGTPRELAAELMREPQLNKMYPAFPAAARLFGAVGGKGECPLSVREGRAFVQAFVKSGAEIHSAIPPKPATTPPQKPSVRLKNVYFRYESKGLDILNGADFTVYPGEITCILGGNGSGKSTALGVMGGVNCPHIGKIEILEKNIKAYKGGSLYKGILAGLPQNPETLFTRETARLELEEMGGDTSETQRIAQLLEISDLLPMHPLDLSGGERQKLAFAKVLLCNAQIYLLDEPLKGLDSRYKQVFGAVLKQLKDAGKTLILATHDIEFAALNADKCCICFNGELSAPLAAKEFFAGNYFYTPAINRIARAAGFNEVLSVEELAAKLRRKEFTV